MAAVNSLICVFLPFLSLSLGAQTVSVRTSFEAIVCALDVHLRQTPHIARQQIIKKHQMMMDPFV